MALPTGPAVSLRGNAIRGAVLLLVVLAVGLTVFYHRRHMVRRAEIGESQPAPLHGVIEDNDGMNGDHRVVVDFDALTIHDVAKTMTDAHDRTARITEADVRELGDLADAATREEGGEPPRVMDSFDWLIVLDGDEAFELSESSVWADETRPAAQGLVRAMSRLSR